MSRPKNNEHSQSWKMKPLKDRGIHITPGRLALIYAFVGIAWIVLSDLLVTWLALKYADAFNVNMMKGLFYVAITTALIFWLARRAQQQTLQKHAVEELTNTQNLLEATLSSLGEAVLMIDPATRSIMQCNPAAERLFGYDRSEIIGQNTEFLHKSRESYEEFSRLSEPVLTEKNIYQDQIQMKRKDLTLIDAQVTVTTIDEKTGWQAGVISIIHDITELKAAERKLQESRKQYLDLVEDTPDIITRVDQYGRFLFVNRAGQKIFGLTEDECIGRPAFDVIHPADRAATMAAFSKWLEGEEKVFSFENRVVNTNGQECFWEWSIRPEYDEDGGVCGFASTARDVTEKKRAEAERRDLQDQLLQAQKMESVGQLAGGIAHDFNNMLGVILGHAELGLKKSAHACRVSTNLKEIHKAAKRSADLTRQLLTFARKQTIQPKLLDINQLVTSMLKILQRVIGENIQVVWSPAPDIWPIKIDPTQFDQILTNLCLNARDAITSNGTITIRTENTQFALKTKGGNPEILPGDYVQLSISDTGCGMDKETLDHIFEPFFTTKEPGIGTGLGLATVMGAVKQHKGYIYASSEPEEGTTFDLYLPREKGVVQTKQDTVETKIREGAETVLLVEDDTMLLNLLKTILEESGYQVLSATNPESAILIAQEHLEQISLLISDLIMPVMNGKQLSEKIRALRPDIKVLFISGYSDEIISSQGVLHENIHVLQKPISPAALTNTVRDILDNPNQV